MKVSRLLQLVTALAIVGIAPVPPASAHPMGNFSINHYSALLISCKSVTIRYILDYAEIPTVAERAAIRELSSNSATKASFDGITVVGQSEYLKAAVERIRRSLQITVDGRDRLLTATPVSITFLKGAGGLQTMRLELDAVCPLLASSAANPTWITYRDDNYADRAGWKEIVARATTGAVITESDVSASDISRQLTIYPVDPTNVPPAQTTARIAVTGSAAPRSTALTHQSNYRTDSRLTPSGHLRSSVAAVSSSAGTPRDAFTESISIRNLTRTTVALSLLIAFGFGALHALSPGHGKAMIGAYLVGSRGTPWHAVVLGVVVTITHTLGVFVLGFAMMAASRYLAPERFYPVLSGASGFLIAGLGLALLRQRWSNLRQSSAIGDEGSLEDAFERYEREALPAAVSTPATKGESDPWSVGPLSLKSLILLGITGGILPCPSALIVLLSAFALHRIAFGLVLILAFSLGLAIVLTVIGVLVVCVRGYADRTPIQRSWLNRVPVASAAFVTMIGVVLLVGSLFGRGY